MNAPGDAGPYSPTQEVIHKIVNWVDDPPPSTAPVREPSIATQGAAQARGAQTKANFFYPTKSDGGASPVFSDVENSQSKHFTVLETWKKEGTAGDDDAERRSD